MTVINAPCEIGLQLLDEGSAQCCITSPPYYGLRDYGHDGQIGLEASPAEYIDRLVLVFREVRRVLRDDGTLWLNIGDTYAVKSTYNAPQSLHTENGWKQAGENKRTSNYAKDIGLKPKDMIGIPWMLAFALRADGWYLRQDIIWHKPNPMPESVQDRCTKAHEYLFLLSKSEQYYFDHEAMKEPAVGGLAGNTKPTKAGRAYEAGATEHRTAAGLPTCANRQRSRRDSFKRAEVIPGQTVGTHRPDRPESNYDVEMRNRRSVWTVATRPYKGAHFATFPPALIEPCVLAGSRPGDLVIDPFTGSGTTWQVAKQQGRTFIGFELNPDYCKLAMERNAE